ncbi:alpha-D-ribose 1-methylphosphonate 5-triphosphate diphosphatase [Campylobacter suis]|uniref:Alpha-D-ribose 1-methylphosphonate 5-triphosphate diphosphatase n=1 Tax=Campylobacter suis TaxID=2790657 RepID=A0ABM8Q8W2_9BACT|nr:alpha-D-ribose 1-methylphosphonate 5-triphosphate diphosphatase [Campylobacter suis]CAD7289337.1 Alpha-D-ribose 1-methylphosphonate 5-triphosphate diphosphatase [Campylobacter suis]
MIICSKNVLIDKEFRPASIEIKDGKISQIKEYGLGYDFGEFKITPGIVDLHSDALEKEIEPRPGASFNPKFAIINLDKKIIMSGITTIYHAISFEENSQKSRNIKNAIEQVNILHDINKKQLLSDNLIHIRFEICHTDAIEPIKKIIDDKKASMLSIMDHTPGQGQFKTLESFMSYYRKHHGMSDEDINFIVEKKQNRDLGKIYELIKYATKNGIATLSHDDDGIEKLAVLNALGIEISEFPLSLEVARYCIKSGLKTGMGAPNIVRGGSQSGNVSAMLLVENEVCSYLCSDYHPSSMLQSVYIIAKHTKRPLAQCFELITKTPAMCAGLNDRGEIKEGLRADLLVIDDKEIPNVLMSIKDGKMVFSTLNLLGKTA